MCFNDIDKYTKDWEDNSEINSSIPLDDYIYSRQVDDYGCCDDELGTDDNEAYDDF